MNIYPMLKKSMYDSTLPHNYAKIKIMNMKKERGNSWTYNGLELRYCSIGICKSEKKFCCSMFSHCPYEKIMKIEQPRRNGKAYENYVKEWGLQMDAAVLKGVFDEQVEKALYDELDKDEYDQLIRDLIHLSEDKLSLSSLENRCKLMGCSKLVRDLFKDLQAKRKSNRIKKEQEKDLVFEIGEYLYIDIAHLPAIKDDNDKILWYSDHWVEKKNFTLNFFIQLEQNSKLQYWLRDEYKKNIEILKEQLEEKFGMMTMFTLQGYNN